LHFDNSTFGVIVSWWGRVVSGHYLHIIGGSGLVGSEIWRVGAVRAGP